MNVFASLECHTYTFICTLSELTLRIKQHLTTLPPIMQALETEMSEDMRMYQSLESDQASLRQLAHAKKREVRGRAGKGMGYWLIGGVGAFT